MATLAVSLKLTAVRRAAAGGAPPGAPYTVSVEANGWVLSVRGPWGATAGAFDFAGADRTEGRFLNGAADQFPLSPDAAPKVTIAVTRQGFTRSAGIAVASAGDVQTLVATKVLRRPYPNHAALDEVDNGDGTRTVRLALSERVHAGDTVASAQFAAGWKLGESGGAVATVANASTVPLPVAISRWAQPSFTLLRGTSLMQVDLIIASHHPRHFGPALHQAVAGVKLTATDGTTTKSFWFTSPQTSSQYGDGLRCWGGQIDLAGLNPGPVTIRHETYPWIGAARAQPAGHSLDKTHSNPIAWDAPLVVCHDPAGTLYPAAHIYVNDATGTTTAASVTVGATLAAAKAGTHAKDISTAVQAIYLQNYSLPARNGWAAATRATDWCTITLAAGVQALGATGVLTGLTSNEGRLIIRGDPDDANPRANCIWRTAAAAPNHRANRFWLENLTVEQGQFDFGNSTYLWHLDNVEVRGKPGYETGNSLRAFSGTSPAGYANMTMTRSRWWKFDGALWGGNARVHLARGVETSREHDAIVHINGSKPVDPYFPSRTTNTAAAFGTWWDTVTFGSDCMIWGCRALDWGGFLFNAKGCTSSGAGTVGNPFTFTRLAEVNCLAERTRGVPDRIFAWAEGSRDQMQDSIFEGCTHLGNYVNGFYNDAPGGDTNLSQLRNTVRNNVHHWHPIKQDIFKTNGALTNSWEHLWGVNYAGNVVANQGHASPSNFQYAFYGLGAAVDVSYATYLTNSFLKLVADKTDCGPNGPTGPGGGDYRPAAGSPMLGRGRPANTDRDIDGNPRGATFASGALEGA